MYYIYILKSFVANKTYVGQTNNYERRLEEHNRGKTKYTSKYIPWKIIDLEKHDSREKAVKREKYFKTASGRRKIKTIIDAHVAQQDRATVS